jgi:hypothetical protein
LQDDRSLRRPTQGDAKAGLPSRTADAAAASSHDAATLAAEEQAGELLPRAITGRIPVSTQISGMPPAPPLEAPHIPSRPAHFTTVEAEDALRQAERRHSWPVTILQLAGLLAVISGMIGLAMYLSRPSSADELYRTITSGPDAAGDSGAKVERALKEFLARFPQDPRMEEVQRVERQIALDRAERRLRSARRSGYGGGPLLPVEQLYLQADAAAEGSAKAGIQMLESLVALYGVPPDESSKDDDAPANAARRQSDCIELAQRRLAALREERAEEIKIQLSSLHERLDTARRLSESDAARAKAMYRAIIDLHDQDDWAKDVVADARRRMDELRNIK